MGAWQYPIPPDASEQTLDWKRFLGPAPSTAYDPNRFFRWRCWWDYSAGVAGDLFVHLLTGLHYITSSNGPKRVMSTGGIYRWKDGRDVPDLHVALYDYPQGFHLNIRVNLGSSGPEVTRFYGTEGTLDVGNDLRLTAQNLYEEPGGIVESWAEEMQKAFMEKYRKEHPLPVPHSGEVKKVDERFVTPPHYDETREHLFNFIQAVRTRQPANEDAEFGTNAATAAHLANLSYKNGRPVNWDPKNQVLS
jgi:predicted dehydrogenase